MGGLSIMHWAVVAIAISLLFGGNRLSRLMGDVGQGIKALRNGLAEDEELPERLSDRPDP
jgi:sec-independent protein translocase protein TatA